jgi:hypothetical protein
MFTFIRPTFTISCATCGVLTLIKETFLALLANERHGKEVLLQICASCFKKFREEDSSSEH